jgi:hypothetical protein
LNTLIFLLPNPFSSAIVLFEMKNQIKLPLYKVTKKHNRGLLKGLITTEETTVKFENGFVCKNAIGGGGYKILECVQIGEKIYG